MALSLGSLKGHCPLVAYGRTNFILIPEVSDELCVENGWSLESFCSSALPCVYIFRVQTHHISYLFSFSQVLTRLAHLLELVLVRCDYDNDTTLY